MTSLYELDLFNHSTHTYFKKGFDDFKQALNFARKCYFGKSLTMVDFGMKYFNEYESNQLERYLQIVMWGR